MVFTSNDHINRTFSNNYNCLYPNQCESEFECVDSIKTINLSEDSNHSANTNHSDYNLSNKIDETQVQYNTACFVESSCKWNTEFDNQRLNTLVSYPHVQSQNVIENIPTQAHLEEEHNENSSTSLVDLLSVGSCPEEESVKIPRLEPEEVLDEDIFKCKNCGKLFYEFVIIFTILTINLF